MPGHFTSCGQLTVLLGTTKSACTEGTELVGLNWLKGQAPVILLCRSDTDSLEFRTRASALRYPLDLSVSLKEAYIHRRLHS